MNFLCEILVSHCIDSLCCAADASADARGVSTAAGVAGAAGVLADAAPPQAPRSLADLTDVRFTPLPARPGADADRTSGGLQLDQPRACAYQPRASAHKLLQVPVPSRTVGQHEDYCCHSGSQDEAECWLGLAGVDGPCHGRV
jgi:hypothetical protein